MNKRMKGADRAQYHNKKSFPFFQPTSYCTPNRDTLLRSSKQEVAPHSPNTQYTFVRSFVSLPSFPVHPHNTHPLFLLQSAVHGGHHTPNTQQQHYTITAYQVQNNRCVTTTIRLIGCITSDYASTNNTHSGADFCTIAAYQHKRSLSTVSPRTRSLKQQERRQPTPPVVHQSVRRSYARLPSLPFSPHAENRFRGNNQPHRISRLSVLPVCFPASLVLLHVALADKHNNGLHTA